MIKRRRRSKETFDNTPLLQIQAKFVQNLKQPDPFVLDVLRAIQRFYGDHEVDHPSDIRGRRETKNKDSLDAIITERDRFIRRRDADLNHLSVGLGVMRHWFVWYRGAEDFASGWTSNPNPPGFSNSRLTPNDDATFNADFYLDSDSCWDEKKTEKWVELVRDLLTVIDATGQCYYATLNVDAAWETRHGFYYSLNTYLNSVSWRRQVEYLDWHVTGQGEGPEGNGRSRVRDMSWGHYLGPKMAERLDPDGTFRERFIEARGDSGSVCEKGENLFLPICERLPMGGMFLAVCGDPILIHHPYGGGHTYGPVRHAAWLWHEFRKAGML